MTSIAKISPIGVSSDEAWALFDRSITVGLAPRSAPIVAVFDASEEVAAVKVYGPAPFQLEVSGSAGISLGFDPIDLSRLSRGWHTFRTNAPTSTAIIELRFEPVGKPSGQAELRTIPEIEIWASTARNAESPTSSDAAGRVASRSVPRREIAPASCASFAVTLMRRPEHLRRAWLEYRVTDALRSFALERTINGGSRNGGHWISGPTGERAVAEQIDPGTLRAGENEIQLCVPVGAERTIAIDGLRLVGELDLGVRLVKTVTLSAALPADDVVAPSVRNDSNAAVQNPLASAGIPPPNDRAVVSTARAAGTGVAALHDLARSTRTEISAATRVLLDFDRLIAPDAVLIDGSVTGSVRVECRDRSGKSSTLTATPQLESRGAIIVLDGGAARCAGLSLEFSDAVSIAELDVIGSGASERIDWPHLVVTSAREHFGNQAWIAAFVARPRAMTTAVRVGVDGEPVAILTGELGRMLQRESTGPWRVAIEAAFPDGTKFVEEVVLEAARAAERMDGLNTASGTAGSTSTLAAQFGREGEVKLVRATPSAAVNIRLGSQVGVDITPGAVAKATDISVKHLGAAALPPLDDGLINVTGPKDHGYEFLPHGQKFKRAVEVVIPFDPSLIPEGMTVEDVHTYFYEPRLAKWIKLTRRALDIGQRVTRSSTDHFTIMINAVLAVPKNPTPLAFDPTALTSIAAATPAANIDLIEPPSASSTGDAQTSLEIQLPSGRGAYSPTLALSYSSSSENGWLGLGWAVSTSKIEIDTRWGTPTYYTPGDPRSQEPRYLLDGAALVPTDETDGPSCSTGGPGRRFRPRIEGSFAHIQRCGTDPSSYFWEVRDRDGTRFIYGGAGASLASYDDRGVFRFALREVVDTHGNTTVFRYRLDSGSSGPTMVEPFRELYLAGIEYTSRGGTPATYFVDFDLDDRASCMEGARCDPMSSGRAGFKIVTRKLLRSIRVRFGSQLIRQYVLTYARGQFHKTVLDRVQVFGTNGCNAGTGAFEVPACSQLFHEHRFDYLTEDEGFRPTTEHGIDAVFDVGALPLHAGLTRGVEASESVGVQFNDLVNLGLSAGVSVANRTEYAGLYDLDGDSLPDQVYLDGDRVAAIYNQSRPGTEPATLFAPRDAPLEGLLSMGNESRHSWPVTTNAQVGPWGGSVSYRSEASSSQLFFADANGDGFLDYLRAGGAHLGRPHGTGMRFTVTPFDATAAIDPRRDPLLSQFDADLAQRLIRGNPVVRWVAPFTGHVRVTGTARKVRAGGVDGATLELFHQDTAIELRFFGPADTGPAGFPTPRGIDVTAGEALYLKLSTGADDGLLLDGTFADEIETRLLVEYTQVCDPTCENLPSPLAARAPTGELVHAFDSREEFRLAGGHAYAIISAHGTLALHALLTRTPAVAPLRACVQRFPAATPNLVPSLDAACDATGTDATNLSGTVSFAAGSFGTHAFDLETPVEVGQIIVLRVESDFSFDPGNVTVGASIVGTPVIGYSQVCLPDDSDTPALVCTTDPNTIAGVPLRSTSFGPSFSLVPSPRYPLVVPANRSLVFDPIILGGDFLLAIRSDRRGWIAEVDCRNQSCGVVTLPAIDATAGESLSLELVRFGFDDEADTMSTISGTYGGGETFSAHLHERVAGPTTANATPFVGGYRGWSATIWNEAAPFAPAALLAAYPSIFLMTDDARRALALTALPPAPAFYGSFANGAPAWAGPASFAFVSAATLHAGYLGMFDGSGAVEDRGGLRHRYIRLSATTSVSAGSSISADPFALGLDMNVGFSSTRTTTDAVDLNGDGILDVLAGNDTFFGRFGSGYGPTESVPGFAVGDGFRRRDGFDFGVGLKGGVAIHATTASGRTIRGAVVNQGTSLGYSTAFSQSIGRSRTTQDLTDLNADGLPDLVRREGSDIRVRLNLGTHFGAEESFGTMHAALADVEIDGMQGLEDAFPGSVLSSTRDALSHDTTISEHRTKSVDLFLYSYRSTKRTSSVRTTRQLADLNGDGLPDLLLKKHGESRIRVQYNLGTTFGEPVLWQTPPWNALISNLAPTVLAPLGITGPDVLGGSGLSRGESSDHSISIPLPYTPITVGGSYGTNYDLDNYELALVDLDGDGAPEHVLRRQTVGGTPTIYVKRNRLTGRANLLKTVHRPLGGSFTLEYSRVGNTVADPNSRHVLTRVEVDDGVDLGAAFASPNLVTTLAYEDGFYHRGEKEFFGFGKVTTRRADGTSVEVQYENSTYPLHGRMQSETRRDSLDRLFQRHTMQYDIRAVRDASETAVGPTLACIERLHPLLTVEGCMSLFVVAIRDDDLRAEGGVATKTRVMRDLAHDRFGNVLTSVDEGDDSIASDDVHATATYHNDPTSWIIGKPATLVVRSGSAGGEILRSRGGTYDAFGDLTSVGVDTGSGIATTLLGYDVVGNVIDVTTPPNHAGESQTIHVEYDAQTHQFPVRVTDGFGYTSSASYDLAFGIPLVEIDTNGAQLSRTLDSFGRLASVSGPYDVAMPAISVEYQPTATPPRAVTTTRSSAPADYSGPLPAPMTTVSFIDGLGRPIAVRETAVVAGVTGMTTSAAIARDTVGRVTRTYHPFFTAGSGASSAFAALQLTAATVMIYDALDRVVSTTHPDGATETTAFAIAPDPAPSAGGALRFHTRDEDANHQVRETFADHVVRTRSYVEHPSSATSSVTAYDYLATGELARITDAEGNATTLGYDLRGLRTSLANPDTGLVEERFDLMGNRVALIEPNHRALGAGAEVAFVYDRDRLERIDYPSKPDVTYVYGSPTAAGAPGFLAGRITEVRDETGAQAHTYGAMGEIRRTLRTVVDPGHPTQAPKQFAFAFTHDSLGHPLRVVYPDGETISNSYDAAGMLQAVSGAGAGWTRPYATELRYDVFGNRTHLRFGNGAVSTWSFDPARVRLATATTTLPGSSPSTAGPRVQDLHYSYDLGGNPTGIANTLATRPSNGHLPGDTSAAFTYDGVDRLIRAVGGGSISPSKTTSYELGFTYTPSHNLARKELAHLVANNGGSNAQNPPTTNFDSAYVYESGRPHLPSRAGDSALTYDPSGNLLARETLSTGSVQDYVWDDDGRLVLVTGQGANQRNVYDASGLRVLREGQTGVTIFASPLYDVDGTNQGQKHVFAGATRVATVIKSYANTATPIAPTQSGTPFYFHADHLGSTGAVSRSDGTLNDAHDYFPDGQEWIDSGPKDPINGYLFNGKPIDIDTGFYDFGQRFYDPRMSLWLGVDPEFVESPESALHGPMFLAPGAFAAHSPLLNTDPDGRSPLRLPTRAPAPRPTRSNPSTPARPRGAPAPLLPGPRPGPPARAGMQPPTSGRARSPLSPPPAPTCGPKPGTADFSASLRADMLARALRMRDPSPAPAPSASPVYGPQLPPGAAVGSSAGSGGSAAANAIAPLPNGEFSVIGWQGYPGGVARPSGPFRLLQGSAYDTARAAANRANAALRAANPKRYAGKQIHEIHPVKYGGSPTDPANKVALTPIQHARFTTFWNRLQRAIE